MPWKENFCSYLEKVIPRSQASGLSHHHRFSKFLHFSGHQADTRKKNCGKYPRPTIIIVECNIHLQNKRMLPMIYIYIYSHSRMNDIFAPYHELPHSLVTRTTLNNHVSRGRYSRYLLRMLQWVAFLSLDSYQLFNELQPSPSAHPLQIFATPVRNRHPSRIRNVHWTLSDTYGSGNGTTSQAGCCGSCFSKSFDGDAFDEAVRKDMEDTRDKTVPIPQQQLAPSQGMTVNSGTWMWMSSGSFSPTLWVPSTCPAPSRLILQSSRRISASR